jgi:hypothetical protein
MERLAYDYDQRRLRPSGLTGELVIPEAELGLSPGALELQFARTRSGSPSAPGTARRSRS